MKGALLLLLALLGTVLIVTTTRQASAVSGTLRVESGTAFVGDPVDIDIIANVDAPGLAAWTFDPSWDHAILDATSCTPITGGLCKTVFDAESGRVTGASSRGLAGEVVLATYHFRCIALGRTDIGLSVEVFADSTVAIPKDIDEDVTEGEVTCVERDPAAVQVGSATAPVGESREVIVAGLNLPVDPGLGSWTFGVMYDEAVVSVEGCEAGPLPEDDPGSSECQLDAPGVIQIRGASAEGLGVDHEFARITFRCTGAGVSALSPTVSVWAIPTVGLVELPPPELTAGSVSCVKFTDHLLPPTGTGARATSSSLPIITVSTFGLFALVSGVLLRRRA